VTVIGCHISTRFEIVDVPPKLQIDCVGVRWRWVVVVGLCGPHADEGPSPGALSGNFGTFGSAVAGDRAVTGRIVSFAGVVRQV